MDQQRSAVDRLEDLKRQFAQARDRHIAGATSVPAVLYTDGQRQRLLRAPRPMKVKLTSDESSRRDQEVADGNRQDLINLNGRVFRFVSSVKHDLPDAVLKEAQQALQAAWPAQRGTSVPKALKLSPKLVKDIHDALIAEDRENQNCKTACAKIASAVGKSDEVIRKLVQQTKGKKP
jgi:hypothetical protein